MGSGRLFFPFVTAYYRTIGLSGTEIGLIGTVSALTGALGAAGWGMLHDRIGKSRLVFTGICWGAILLAFLLGRLTDFALILPVSALLTMFTGPSVSQMDSMTLKLLGPNHGAYGSHRVWGTVGFVITSAVAGQILQATSIDSIFYIFPGGHVPLLAGYLAPARPVDPAWAFLIIRPRPDGAQPPVDLINGQRTGIMDRRAGDLQHAQRFGERHGR